MGENSLLKSCIFKPDKSIQTFGVYQTEISFFANFFSILNIQYTDKQTHNTKKLITFN